MSSLFRPILIAMLAMAIMSVGHAIADDFPTLRNTDSDASAVPMAADEAAAAMVMPEGFSATVFASEPDVQNPIAMAWDTKGQLWIAENFTYAERQQRFDLSFRDRVLVFGDTNGDGKADKPVVFTDQVQMLTSVEVGHGGVWLMCPPQLLFIPDADKDFVPDGPAQVVLDGFTVAQANYHNFANGLRFGPDGWLYGRCGGSCPGSIGAPDTPSKSRIAIEGGIWRYHPVRKTVEVLTAGTTNPWGHDWNEFGELFFTNTVNGHFWHAIPGSHFDRPFNLDPNPRTYETIDTHADHYHFDTGKSWTQSRDGAANSLGGGHAHCGAMFYLGTAWPEQFRGKFFTANFHGKRLNQESVDRLGSGYVAKHDPDFCIANDPFFRCMDLSVGPDGNVVMIDWSDTGECHEHTGVHRTSGRIYKIEHQWQLPYLKIGDVATFSSAELVSMHQTDNDNEWAVRKARLVLHERTAAGQDLRETFASLHALAMDEHSQTAVRAAMTLVACEQVDTPTALAWLNRDNEHLRVWAIRAMFDGMPIDDVFGPRNTVRSVDEKLLSRCVEAAKQDRSGLVRLALASSLQRLPVANRAELAAALMSRPEDAEDHNLPLLVWYGLMPVADADANSLVAVAIASRWPKTQRLISRRLAETMHEDIAPVDRLLERMTTVADDAIRENVVTGIADAMKGWGKAPLPTAWPAFAKSIRETETSLAGLVRELGVVFGDGRAMDEIRNLVLNESTEIGVRRSALISLVNQRPDDLRDICAKLLGDQRLSKEAAQGLAFDDDPETAKLLIKNYGKFRGTDRPGIIAILVSRKTFAFELVDAIANDRIAKNELSAFDARQIRSFNDDALASRLAEAWGVYRESPQDRLEAMQKLRQTFTETDSADADLSKGRVVFAELCGKCHRMYGEGQKIGPDLTGSDRKNLDYLLENIIDPSAVVSKDYRVSVVIMTDGRVLNGVIVSTNKRTTSLQTQTDLLVLDNEDIEETKQTGQSPMPEGQLDTLTPEQVKNLFAYLRHPSQVALP